MRFITLITILLTAIGVLSCEKEPGPGGKASIEGRLKIIDYNGICTVIIEEYYPLDEEVFIIYGDDPSYSDRIRTGPNGVFWFPNLRMGDYTIYAITDSCDAPEDTVSVSVEITDRDQEIKLNEMVVLR